AARSPKPPPSRWQSCSPPLRRQLTRPAAKENPLAERPAAGVGASGGDIQVQKERQRFLLFLDLNILGGSGRRSAPSLRHWPQGIPPAAMHEAMRRQPLIPAVWPAAPAGGRAPPLWRCGRRDVPPAPDGRPWRR